MTSSFFSFFCLLKFVEFPNIKNPRFFTSLNFLNYSNPVLAIIFSFILFSFAGVPPLGGFFAKFFVIYSAINSNLFLLTSIILLLNCISSFYYINLIRKNYFNKIDSIYLPVYYSPDMNNNSILVSILFFLIVLIFADFNFIFLFSNLMLSSFSN